MADANEKDEAPKSNSNPEEDETPQSNLNLEEDEAPKSNSNPEEDESPHLNSNIEEDEAPKSNSNPEENEAPKPNINPEEIEAPKSNSNPEEDVAQTVITPSTILSNMEEKDEEEEYEEEEHDDDEEQEEEKDEKVNDGENAMVVVVNDDKTNKENTVKEDVIEETKNDKELVDNPNKKEKRPRNRNKNKNKDVQNASGVLAINGDKPESSSKKKALSKRVESMGMVFMCSSKTKTDCFRYKILGLPGNKKDQVAKIYKGMRLFLFDVDLRLMYGIFKAAGPGGYNLEPKAFNSEFPSQVRFTVLEDCLPLGEEKFRNSIKQNYYTRNKFEGLLKAEQVQKLCKLFVDMGRGGPRPRPKPIIKPHRLGPVINPRIKINQTRRKPPLDSHTSRPCKRLPRDEEIRPRSRSPPRREKRRYTEYERHPVPRYQPPPPPVAVSPVRLYTYERPLDIPPPYVRERVPEHHHTYRVVDVDRVDPYYRREVPVYTLPPEYHLVSREYHHHTHPPSSVQTPEYRRVPNYRDVGIPPPEYRSSGAPAIQEYRSRTHYRY